MATLFVEQLTVMDFSYVHPVRGLLGESWIVDVMLTGDLDEQGMVFDFGDVKKQIKQGIDQLYDHRLLVPARLPAFNAVRVDDQLALQWQDTQQRLFSHTSPESAVVLLPCEEITPDSIAPLLSKQLQRLVPANVAAVTVNIRPEQIEGAFYHYSHGLKKHRGNCQRIAHGHRSRLEVRLDGARHPGLEAEWAERWRDIYIGTRADLLRDIEDAGVHYYLFGYHACQGYFELCLPAAHCYLIEVDSTVELLAEHLAEQIHHQHPGRRVEVKAFEGVMKGALATR
jgi:6-pyruvoyl-tetrahydropterin synthase